MPRSESVRITQAEAVLNDRRRRGPPRLSLESTTAWHDAHARGANRCANSPEKQAPEAPGDRASRRPAGRSALPSTAPDQYGRLVNMENAAGGGVSGTLSIAVAKAVRLET